MNSDDQETRLRDCFAPALAVLIAVILFWSRSGAQIPPPAKPAGHVKMIKGPELESAGPNMAILQWTSTNPGGDDEHYAVAHYGTDPRNLKETAKSLIRLNRYHPETIFRVRLVGLKPQTAYYYWVTSVGADGRSDPVKSKINKFTTPPHGAVTIVGPLAK
jgi:Purple acid Phosphatase, N-terminal domain